VAVSTGNWPESLEGRYVKINRLNTGADLEELYEVSHAQDSFKELWTYMFYGPFADKASMGVWLDSIQESCDPLYYTVTSKTLNKRVGMCSVLNIVTEMRRGELGNIWYSPLSQKSRVNTEVTYLLLRYLFDELRYRRVEWKCDNLNEPSKRAALRMGFKYEGTFRQHMIVKEKNRDTAWFSIIDTEWQKRKESFEQYLSSSDGSLTEINKTS
jgi:RimJ/RimL family protein N-acetyltransferase